MSVVKNRSTQRDRDFWDHVEAIAAQVRAKRESVSANNIPEPWCSVIAQLEAERDALRQVLTNLIAGMCKQCAKGLGLKIEPSTGHYTHSLGGNYCSASFIHHEMAALAQTSPKEQP